MLALHEHNEARRSQLLCRRLEAGEDIALISDAGTPLVSDPGYPLVRAVRDAGLRVVPVPGPAACIAALSVSGLPADRFVFEGFLPPRQAARRQRLETLRSEQRTLLFYESPHRVLDCLRDLAAVFGNDRELVIARELTKTFETVRSGTCTELVGWLEADANRRRGEFVLVVRGAPRPSAAEPDAAQLQLLALLLEELPLKRAAVLAAKLTGISRKQLYACGLAMQTSRRP
jgi:16S rRNA (cytidine1402-2'-O)-methyltransferase